MRTLEESLMFLFLSVGLFIFLYMFIERVIFRAMLKEFQSLCPGEYWLVEKKYRKYKLLFTLILCSWFIVFVVYNLFWSGPEWLKSIYTNMFAAVAVAFLQEAEAIDGNKYCKYICISGGALFIWGCTSIFDNYSVTRGYVNYVTEHYEYAQNIMDNFGTPILTGMFVYGICAKLKEVSGIAKSATHEAIETKEVKENHREEC